MGLQNHNSNSDLDHSISISFQELYYRSDNRHERPLGVHYDVDSHDEIPIDTESSPPAQVDQVTICYVVGDYDALIVYWNISF